MNIKGAGGAARGASFEKGVGDRIGAGGGRDKTGGCEREYGDRVCFEEIAEER